MSSTNGVTATKLIDKLCEGKPVTMQDIDAVYHKIIKASKEELWEACKGIVSSHHVYLLETIRANNRTKWTFYKAHYHRIAVRKGKKRAAVAVAHSILKSVYHVLKDNVPYHELGEDCLNS